jgi:rhodanese-related sulfurtransferase
VKWHSLKKSSVFNRGGHESRKKLLYLQFRRTGVCYCYHGVSSKIWKQFLAAESHGQHFNRSILRQFKCEKLPVWFSCPNL